MRRACVVVTMLAAACAPAGAPRLERQEPAASSAARVTPLARTTRTMSNQPLRLPQGATEMVAASVHIPPGGATPIHRHPWSRFVYVEQGPVRVINHDTGETRDVPSGEVLPEAVDQWHEGRALASPVRLVVIDLVPPGAGNVVPR